MDGAGDNDELHRETGFLIGGGEFLGLLGWHLWIGVAVQEKQGRVVRVNVFDWAGELGEFRLFGGLTAEEELQRRHADAAAVLGALLEDGHEIRGAEQADDALHVARLVEVSADIAFKFLIAIGDTDEGGEMAARRRPGDYDAVGVDAQFGLVCAEEADRGFDIVGLCREGGLSGESVIDADDGEAFIDERAERAVFFRSSSPRASVDINDEGRVRLFRNIKIELQRQVADAGVFDIALDVDGSSDGWQDQRERKEQSERKTAQGRHAERMKAER